MLSLSLLFMDKLFRFTDFRIGMCFHKLKCLNLRFPLTEGDKGGGCIEFIFYFLVIKLFSLLILESESFSELDCQLRSRNSFSRLRDSNGILFWKKRYSE